ncbi:hypothetical protein IPA_05785 [Ignicoccus pacificus DSM 13166]|uniref:Probable membrane transporter protein n=1 Tax=Ignicoccus pacificus DSM 13166 TaxID=940294 RepID=A0A977KBB4_9CREN|nr:hypothetical protein IPA_05785 [Ignicoccus pacificus DSM 13166]
MLEALLGGLLAGTLAGSLGVGGGAITIPILLFIFKLPAPKAIATNLLVVEATALFSLFFHLRQGTLRKVGVIMGLSGVLGTIVGNAIFFELAKGYMLEKVLGGVFLFLAVLMWINEEGQEELSLEKLVIVGFLAGIYSGVIGKGGGSLAVPLLVMMFKVRTKEAIGATAASTPIIALSSLIPKALSGLVVYQVALWFAPGAAVGTMIGSKLMKKGSPKLLRRIFSLFLASVGLKLLL